MICSILAEFRASSFSLFRIGASIQAGRHRQTYTHRYHKHKIPLNSFFSIQIYGSAQKSRLYEKSVDGISHDGVPFKEKSEELKMTEINATHTKRASL